MNVFVKKHCQGVPRRSRDGHGVHKFECNLRQSSQWRCAPSYYFYVFIHYYEVEMPNIMKEHN